MHIEVRIQSKKGADGKKKKYYLAHSLRRGKKVRKLRFYLGVNLSEKEITQKRKYAEAAIKERIRAEEIISDPFHTVLSSKEQDELKALEAKCDIKISHLSEMDWAKYIRLFTYDTNAIEGSTLTAPEVDSILVENKLPKDKSKYDISETYGVSEAVQYIRKTKEHISLNLMIKIHEIVFKDSKDFAGKFRSKGIEVAVVNADGKIIHRGAPSAYVAKLLDELVNWYNLNKMKYPPIALAAVVHNQFENVHPFQDGNGRVGRLLLNNILLKHGLPPVNIELKNRAQYYNALQEYEKNQNLRPTIELIIKEYKVMNKLFSKK